MPHDIFKLFKKSIEEVQVMKLPRGTFSNETPVYDVTLKAIVKLRDGMAEAIENSEDKNNTSSVHFKIEDAAYVEVGNFVKVQGEWRTIERIRWAKDFDTGKDKFLYAFVGTDIFKIEPDVEWSNL